MLGRWIFNVRFRAVCTLLFILFLDCHGYAREHVSCIMSHWSTYMLQYLGQCVCLVWMFVTVLRYLWVCFYVHVPECHHSIYLFVYLSVYQSIYLSISPSIQPSNHPSTHPPSIPPPIHPSVHPSTDPYQHVYTHTHTHAYIHAHIHTVIHTYICKHTHTIALLLDTLCDLCVLSRYNVKAFAKKYRPPTIPLIGSFTMHWQLEPEEIKLYACTCNSNHSQCTSRTNLYIHIYLGYIYIYIIYIHIYTYIYIYIVLRYICIQYTY